MRRCLTGKRSPFYTEGDRKLAEKQGYQLTLPPTSIVRLSSRRSPPPSETVSQCHSEALAPPCGRQGRISAPKCHPELSEGSHEFLRYAQDKLNGVYPGPRTKILRLAQNDRRRVLNDRHGIPPIVTQSLRGRGGGGMN